MDCIYIVIDYLSKIINKEVVKEVIGLDYQMGLKMDNNI